MTMTKVFYRGWNRPMTGGRLDLQPILVAAACA